MKIVEVKVHPLRTALQQPFAFSQGWVKNRSATLVEVVTDEGITGWGEAFAQGLEPPQIAAAVIQSALTPLLLGADPLVSKGLQHLLKPIPHDGGSGSRLGLQTISGCSHKGFGPLMSLQRIALL